MKKLLTSALITGLFLGTVSPVFADITLEDIDTKAENSETTVTTNVTAKYDVTIPSNLNINLMTGEKTSADGAVLLNNLTADGSVLVEIKANDMILDLEGVTEETAAQNERIEVTVDTSSFHLENSGTQNIQFETIENSEDNVAGDYSGIVTFSFDYVRAEATPPAE